MLLYKDEEMTIIRTEAIPGEYGQAVYSGTYIKNTKGYWYRLDLKWGTMYRIKDARQIRELDKLLD
jgi:hypothetical protein